MRGIRLRTVGVGAKIFEELGAIVRDDIPFSSLYTALKRGDLDVVEWAAPSDDLKQRFFEITSYAMLPGWHEPGSIFQLIINRDRWRSLSKEQQNEIVEACEYSFVRLAAAYNFFDGEALQELQRRGAIFIQWNTAFLQTFYAIAQKMLQKYRLDPIFSELYDIIEQNTKAFNAHYLMQVAPLVDFMETVNARFGTEGV